MNDAVRHIGGTGMALMIAMYFVLLYLTLSGFARSAPISQFVLAMFTLGATVAIFAFVLGLLQ